MNMPKRASRHHFIRASRDRAFGTSLASEDGVIAAIGRRLIADVMSTRANCRKFPAGDGAGGCSPQILLKYAEQLFIGIMRMLPIHHAAEATILDELALFFQRLLVIV